MAKAARNRWAFKAGMRARSYSWRGSQKAIARLKGAVSEIKVVRRRDPVAAGEGVVSLAERIWPAFEQIDTSTGALGNAVNRTLESLIPILIAAPADEKIRAEWLVRLYDAINEDGVQYLFPISERFGEIAVYPGLISTYADRDIDMIRMAWSDRTAFGFVATDTLCLSCLLEAGRTDELFALLDLRQNRMWSDDRFGAEALVRQGRLEEALVFAEEQLALERQGYNSERDWPFLRRCSNPLWPTRRSLCPLQLVSRTRLDLRRDLARYSQTLLRARPKGDPRRSDGTPWKPGKMVCSCERRRVF